MENIEQFLKAAEAYGVPKSSTFQTVDLYENRNMAQVLLCLVQLGTEAQRNGFAGPTIGACPALPCPAVRSCAHVLSSELLFLRHSTKLYSTKRVLLYYRLMYTVQCTSIAVQ